MNHYTLAELTTALLRFVEVALRLAPPSQSPEIVDVDYEEVTDIEEEEPGEEAYCVPI